MPLPCMRPKTTDFPVVSGKMTAFPSNINLLPRLHLLGDSIRQETSPLPFGRTMTTHFTVVDGKITMASLLSFNPFRPMLI